MLHLCFMFSAMLSLAAPVRICVVCPALSIEKHCYPALLESGSQQLTSIEHIQAAYPPHHKTLSLLMHSEYNLAGFSAKARLYNQIGAIHRKLCWRHGEGTDTSSTKHWICLPHRPLVLDDPMLSSVLPRKCD